MTNNSSFKLFHATSHYYKWNDIIMTKFPNRFCIVQFERCNAYVELSLLSASLLSSGPDTIFKSPDLLITAVICEEKRYKVKIKQYTVEPRSKEPLYKDVLGTTKEFLYIRYIEVPLSVNFPLLPPPIIIIHQSEFQKLSLSKRG